MDREGVGPPTAADDTVIPPQLNWTPTPPAREAVNMPRWTALLAQLVEEGRITAEEQTLLMQPVAATASGAGEKAAREHIMSFWAVP